jgi:hypothetical protein
MSRAAHRGVLGTALEQLGVLPPLPRTVSLRGQTRAIDGFTLTLPGAICLDFAKHMREELRERNADDPLRGIILGEDLETAWTWTDLDEERGTT